MELHRLKAVTEVDACALTQVLQLFESRSVVPYRILAQRAAVFGNDQQVLKIEIDVAAAEMDVGALRLMAAKIHQLSRVLTVTVADRAP